MAVHVIPTGNDEVGMGALIFTKTMVHLNFNNLHQ